MAKQSVEKRLLHAQSLMRKGALQDARAAANDVLQDFPANKKAKQLLTKIEQAKTAGPVAMTTTDQDKLRQLVQIIESGDYVRAADMAARYTKVFPRSALVWNVGAAANKALGRNETAIAYFERVAQITPTDADAHFNLGILLQDEGRLRAACDSYRRAIGLRPKDAEAVSNLGKAIFDLGDVPEAITYYNRAIEIDPTFAGAQLYLGDAQKENGHTLDAIACYERAVELDPKDPEGWHRLGQAMYELGKGPEAIAACERALDLAPDSPKVLNGAGVVLSGVGRKDDAIEAYKKALSISPDFTKAHRNLSMLKKYTERDQQFQQMEFLYNEVKLKDEDRSYLCFGLAKAHEDFGDLRLCFDLLTEGNAYKKKDLGYQIDEDHKLFAKIRAHDFSQELPPIAEDAPQPIFILGMPRSGTTLTEQIISAHSEVYGAGELGLIGQFGLQVMNGQISGDRDALIAFRERYLNFLRDVSEGEPFVVDKMPHNFRFVGLIRQLFPNAKIVHTRRDARAVCWSNFKLPFPAKGLGYSNDIHDVAEFYTLYRDLMAFWADKYGDHIVELNYETLTEHQEAETRALIADLDLEWQDACLEPDKNKRVARTASSEQVKRKVYTGSSEKWRAFDPFIGDAFDAL